MIKINIELDDNNDISIEKEEKGKMIQIIHIYNTLNKLANDYKTTFIKEAEKHGAKNEEAERLFNVAVENALLVESGDKE